MYTSIYNALARNKFLRNSEYPKDHLSSHFFQVLWFLCRLRSKAAHRYNFVWRLSVRPSVRVVWPIETFSWSSRKAVSQATQAVTLLFKLKLLLLSCFGKGNLFIFLEFPPWNEHPFRCKSVKNNLIR